MSMQSASSDSIDEIRQVGNNRITYRKINSSANIHEQVEALESEYMT